MTIDHHLVAEAIGAHKSVFFSGIERALENRLKAMSPSRTLTFRLMSGESETRIVAPNASLEYVKVLMAFMRGNSFEGFEVDSAVTPEAIDAVTVAVQEFYASGVVTEAIAGSITSQLEASQAIRDVLKGEGGETASWLKKEIRTVSHLASAHSITGDAIDAAAEASQQFLNTAAGSAFVGIVAKVMATAGGKIMVMKILQAAVAKVMASASAKVMISGFVKKVGVGILMKTVVGKAIIAFLAMLGIANIPLAYVILPIIAGFLIYEYNTFPEKLATKVPAHVVAEMRKSFDPLNQSIAHSLVSKVLEGAADELTKIKLSA